MNKVVRPGTGSIRVAGFAPIVRATATYVRHHRVAISVGLLGAAGAAGLGLLHPILGGLGSLVMFLVGLRWPTSTRETVVVNP